MPVSMITSQLTHESDLWYHLVSLYLNNCREYIGIVNFAMLAKSYKTIQKVNWKPEIVWLHFIAERQLINSRCKNGIYIISNKD